MATQPADARVPVGRAVVTPRWVAGHQPHRAGVAAVLDAMGDLVDAAAALDEEQLRTAVPSSGWTAGDVLVHVHLGLQDMLLGLLTPTGAAVPGRSRCDYRPGRDAARRGEHEAVVRGITAAYTRPSRVVERLAATVDAASTGVVDVLRPGTVLADGRPVCTGDYLAAWAREVSDQHRLLDPAR